MISEITEGETQQIRKYKRKDQRTKYMAINIIQNEKEKKENKKGISQLWNKFKMPGIYVIVK